MTSLNDFAATYMCQSLPFGGVKQSGLGREQSKYGLAEFMDMKTVVLAFHEAQRSMAGRWEQLAAADAAKPLGRTLPDGSDTVAGGLRFLAWHEAYHLGQLGFLRRMAGRPGRA